MSKESSRRDVFLNLAWIGLIILAGGLSGQCTWPYRSLRLAGEVNSALAQSGDTRRVLPAASGFAGFSPETGIWYGFDEASGSGGEVFVFNGGYNGAAACAALINTEGKVSALLPLGGSAAQLVKELPPPLYQFYINRAAKAFQKKR